LEKAILARLESQDDGKRTMTWKAGGAEAPSFVSLGAEGAYFMRTVCGGGCWDLKVGKEREGFEGLRGMNKFLEECRDFSNIAVGLLEKEDGVIEADVYIVGSTSLPITSECVYPDSYYGEGILESSRMHMGRLQ
jgi:hypothetical protein